MTPDPRCRPSRAGPGRKAGRRRSPGAPAPLTVFLALALAGCGPGTGASSEAEGARAEGGGTEAPSAEGRQDAAPEIGSDGPVAFVSVNVVPMDVERIQPDRTVLVRDGRIAAIGAADEVEVPDGAVRVEGEGRYLIPGLGEMHAHVPPQAPEGMELDEWAERVLFLYLSNGITTVRGMLGQPMHLTLRDRVRSGELRLAPRFYTSGPSINGSSIPDPDSAVRAVRHQVEAGYDFLKIHPGLSLAAYDAMAETAREAGIRWAGHVPAAVGVPHALEAGQGSIDHLDQYVQALVPGGTEDGGLFPIGLVDRVDESRLPELARATAEAGTWNVPTQSLAEVFLLPDEPEELAEGPGMRYMPEEVVRSWMRAKRSRLDDEAYTPEAGRRLVELRERIIAALHEAGAPLLLGSDAPQVFQVPGFSIHHELRTLISSGLTPFEALATGTRNVALYFDALDEYGTVEPGKVADLVLLEGNPLEDVANVERQAGVVVRGLWVPAEEIERRLETIAASGTSP